MSDRVVLNRELQIRRGGVRGYQTTGGNMPQATAAITMEVYNNSGGALARGDIVIFDRLNSTDNLIYVTTTTIADHRDVLGVVFDTGGIPASGTGLIQTWGIIQNALKVNGGTAIVAGDRLGSYTSAGVSAKAASAKTGFAIALSGYSTNDSAGLIDAFITVGIPSFASMGRGTAPASTTGATGTAAPATLSATGTTGGASSNAAGTGGVGGGWAFTSGVGGAASGASSTGGAGGAVAFTGGVGGVSSGATASTGGAGGAVSMTGGAGGASSAAGTDVGGAGGAASLVGGAGGAATVGSSTTGGAGGSVAVTAGTGGNGTTAGGVGGSVVITAGSAGTGGNVAGGSVDLKGGAATGSGTIGNVRIEPATATPAGGSTRLRLLFGSTAGLGIYFGSSSPTVSAAQGSLYLRSDGSSSSTRAYINSDGGTTWVAVTTAS